MTALVFLILPAIPSAPIEAEQRLGRAICRLLVDQNAVELSGELRLRLTIDGPAPIDVDLPRPLTASPDWQVSAQAPTTESLPDGRERWVQSFRLKPFQTGAVPLKLQPIRYRTGNEVRDWEVTWPARDIRVSSEVSKIDLSSARTVTDLEPLPPVEPKSNTPWYIAVVAILLIAAGGFLLASRLRKGVKPRAALSACERALAELARFDPPAPEQLPQIADVLRHFLEQQFQLAATRQTTGEFHQTLRAANVLSAAQVESVAEILTRCDLVKFAGVRLEREACESLMRRARLLVTEAGTAGQGVPPGSGPSPR